MSESVSSFLRVLTFEMSGSKPRSTFERGTGAQAGFEKQFGKRTAGRWPNVNCITRGSGDGAGSL
jgi:hypothetical protein